MEAKLIVVRGNASRREVVLKLPATIGRSRDADLTVCHPSVSRMHCRLLEIGGQLVVRDEGSLNGTFVGQARVTEAVLQPGGQLSIGPLTFEAVYEPAPPTVPAGAVETGALGAGSPPSAKQKQSDTVPLDEEVPLFDFLDKTPPEPAAPDVAAAAPSPGESIAPTPVAPEPLFQEPLGTEGLVPPVPANDASSGGKAAAAKPAPDDELGDFLAGLE